MMPSAILSSILEVQMTMLMARAVLFCCTQVFMIVNLSTLLNIYDDASYKGLDFFTHASTFFNHFSRAGN